MVAQKKKFKVHKIISIRYTHLNRYLVTMKTSETDKYESEHMVFCARTSVPSKIKTQGEYCCSLEGKSYLSVYSIHKKRQSANMVTSVRGKCESRCNVFSVCM